MTLTLTPLRCRGPRKNRGIPTIPAGHLDGGTTDVSTVDTELLTCLTPRRSGEVLVAGPGALTRSHSKTTSAAGPCTPAYAGLTRHGVSTTSGTCLYPRIHRADRPTATVEPTSCLYPREHEADAVGLGVCLPWQPDAWLTHCSSPGRRKVTASTGSERRRGVESRLSAFNPRPPGHGTPLGKEHHG